MTTIFKIRRKSDGLFSTGGTSPKFEERGKAWKARNHVTSHMTQIEQAYDSYRHHSTVEDYYEDCEVVEFEVTETQINAIPVLEWTEAPSTTRKKELAEQRYQERVRQSLESKKQWLEAELAELSKKIG